MTRHPRRVAAGIPRGNRREAIFFENGDHEIYFNLLAEQTRKVGVAVWAYCLMPNHVHLILKPMRSDDLGRAVGETHRRYTNFSSAHGRRLTAQPSGGTLTSYSYDAGSRLTGITQGTAQVGFSYDSANRRSTLTLPNGVVVQYGYDSDSRVASLGYSYGGNSIGNLVYAYDADGRRTAVTGSLAQTALPASYGRGTYDAANELTAWNGTAFSYDADGNMTTGLYGQQYAWDARNRLASLTGSSAASFSYDAFGRRIGEIIAGTTTGFQYDGVNRINETTGGNTATILTGGVDEFFERTDSNGTTVPLADALGSTIGMTDSSGSLATTYSYDPYGGTMSGGAGSYNTSEFTGRENDGTGLYYYRARYYNPAIGRFINSDPIGFAGGINFYAYTGDNPVSLIDPFGLKPPPPLGCTGSGAACDPNNPPSNPPNNPCSNGQGSSSPSSGPQGNGFDQLVPLMDLQEDLEYPLVNDFMIPAAMMASGAVAAVAGGAATFGLAEAGPIGYPLMPFTTGVALSGAAFAFEGGYYGVTHRFVNPANPFGPPMPSTPWLNPSEEPSCGQ